MHDLDIVAVGEPLMELCERDEVDGRSYRPGFGGDTSNCIIAAARQDARTGYVTAVGGDGFGHDFLALWDRERVDRSAVTVRHDAGTGLYLISYGRDGHEFSYYRRGSAASLLTPEDLPAAYLARTAILHLSGISQAISETACDAAFAAMRAVRAQGGLVSYDTNLRLRLWPLDRARAVIHAAMALADIALPGLDDARILLGVDDPDTICDRYLALGPGIVALTLGQGGCLVATRETRRRIEAVPTPLVDASGAGDTFDGAFLAEYRRTGDPFRAGLYANTAAGLSIRGPGAVTPIPRRAEVEAFLAAHG